MFLKQYIEKYKTTITLSIIIAILTSLNLYMLFLLNNKEEEEIEPIIETKEKEIKNLKVDIKGEIVHPGLYEVSKGSRVMDIIEKAGGLTKSADTSIINLSKIIKDEMVIIVYSKEEVRKIKENKKETKITCPTTNNACIGKEQLEILTENKTKNETNTNQKININTATIEELQTLTGIGEAKAKSIIEYRNNQGNFKKIEEIQNVNGIGEAVYEKIKDNISI